MLVIIVIVIMVMILINDHGDGVTTMMMLMIICNGDQMFETDHKEKVLMIIPLPSRA